MSDIFISYHKDDVDRANVLQGALREFGWSIWWDHEIATSQVYDEAITSELYTAKCVLVLWTKKSVSSQRVKGDTQIGADRNVLFPIIMDDVEIPMDFKRFQTANLSDWDGSSEHPIFKDLVRHISNLIDADYSKEAVPDRAGTHQDNRKGQEESEKLQREVEEQRKLKEAELENRAAEERRLQAEKEATQKEEMKQLRKERTNQRKVEKAELIRKAEEEEHLRNAQEERQLFDEEYRDDQQKTEHALKKKSGLPFAIIIMVIIVIAFLGWKDEIVQTVNSIAPSPQQTVVVYETNPSPMDEETEPVLKEDGGKILEEPEPVLKEDADKILEESELVLKEDADKILEEPKPVLKEDNKKILEEPEPVAKENAERIPDEKLQEKIAAEPITINEKSANDRDVDQQGISSNDQQKGKKKIDDPERTSSLNASIAESEDFVTCQSVNNKQPTNIRNEFQRSQNISVWAAINAPKNESLTIEWLDLDKKIVKPTRVNVTESPKYRIWDINAYAQPGEYEVRLRNGANEIIASKVFVVK